jgi:hypothetical protein
MVVNQVLQMVDWRRYSRVRTDRLDDLWTAWTQRNKQLILDN